MSDNQMDFIKLSFDNITCHNTFLLHIFMFKPDCTALYLHEGKIKLVLCSDLLPVNSFAYRKESFQQEQQQCMQQQNEKL